LRAVFTVVVVVVCRQRQSRKLQKAVIFWKQWFTTDLVFQLILRNKQSLGSLQPLKHLNNDRKYVRKKTTLMTKISHTAESRLMTTRDFFLHFCSPRPAVNRPQGLPWGLEP
jgi:hypothetical protein